jgi:signal transduction histidine kinase
MITPNSADSINLAKSARLLRQMNHDLRNPLNALIATANMLSEGIYDPLTPEQARAVERIERNSKRIVVLLDDLITYVKADAGEYKLDVTDFDPRRLLEDVRGQCQAAAQAKHILLLVTNEDTVPPMLCGDAAAVRRIILALAWNAISFTAKGTVEIFSAWSANAWLVTVTDTGPGVPITSRPHLFEAFWRGDAPASPVPTSGCGLGLAMARALAKPMHGDVQLKVSGIKGSTFSVCLPLVTGVSSTT